MSSLCIPYIEWVLLLRLLAVVLVVAAAAVVVPVEGSASLTMSYREIGYFPKLGSHFGTPKYSVP